MADRLIFVLLHESMADKIRIYKLKLKDMRKILPKIPKKGGKPGIPVSSEASHVIIQAFAGSYLYREAILGSMLGSIPASCVTSLNLLSVSWTAGWGTVVLFCSAINCRSATVVDTVWIAAGV